MMGVCDIRSAIDLILCLCHTYFVIKSINSGSWKVNLSDCRYFNFPIFPPKQNEFQGRVHNNLWFEDPENEPREEKNTLKTNLFHIYTEIRSHPKKIC